MTKLPVLKILITVSVYCCVFANGICSNIYGPTWLDLKSLMDTTLEKMSISISLRAAFFCAGALIGGFIYKLIDRGALYPLFILTKGLCVSLIPLYANYHAFLVYSAIIGLVSGAADTSVNVWIIDIWKDRSPPFVQALQFFWALGFILSPLISNPFLSQESIQSYKNKKFNKFSTTRSPLSKDIISSDYEHMELVKQSKLYIPYMIAGSICLIGSISLLVIYIYKRIERCTTKNKLEENGEGQFNKKIAQEEKNKLVDNFEDHPDVQFTKSKVYLIQILLYCCIMTSVFCASEMTTFQYIPTFTVCLGFSKFIGNIIMTAVAVSFAIGRFCGILFAIKFKPIYILLSDWLIIFVGNMILLLSGTYVLCLWLGTILIGIGYSSFFASIFSFLRERIVVNNFISSIVILSSLSGNAIGFPVFIGKYIDTMPVMMIYGNLFCAIVMFICFLGLLILDWKFGVKAEIVKKLKKLQTHELIEKPNQ